MMIEVYKKMKYIAVDTEYNNERIPFIATSTDENLNTILYDLKKKKDIEKLRALCGSTKISKVFHAGVNDIFALSNIGIDVNLPYEDTLIAASLINENYESKKLKRLAEKYLDEDCLEDKELSKVKSKYKREAKKAGRTFSYEDIPAKILYPYAKKDTEYTLKLWYLFKNQLLKKYKDLYGIEKKLIPIIVNMVKMGVNIDRKFLNEMCKEYRLGGLRVNNELNRILKLRTINYASPKQLNEALLKLKIDIKKRSEKTGLMSTDSETIKDYLKSNPNCQFLKLVLHYRFYKKHRGTYYYPLLKGNYSIYDKNIAHFMFYQSGAKTGRFSADLIQTIPRQENDDNTPELNRVREAFIARPEYTLLSIDYDQIEMRVFAHFSNATRLIKNIIDGFDPHLGTAVTLFGKKILKLSKDEIKKYRKIAKNINFGIIYGMGKNKLARSLGLPMIEAENVLNKYYSKYPVKEFMKMIIGDLYRKGYLHVSFNSPLMKFERDYQVPQDKAYKAVNVLVQGTSAYIMKLAMIRVVDYINNNHLNIRLLMTVHDELIFEVSEEYSIQKIYKILADIMSDRVTFKVPIVGSGKYGKSYGIMEDLK